MNRLFVTVALSLAVSSAGAAGLLASVGDFARDKAIEKAVEIGGDKLKAAAQDRLGIGQALPPVDLPKGGFEQCSQLFPRGSVIDLKSVDAVWRPRALCSGKYAVLYSGLSKTPLLVIERLSTEQLNEALDERRTDEFFVDPRVPRADRAELDDYVGSGFDRGHMAPAADMPDQQAMAQSFVLTNVIPQDPHNNRKVWSKIESDTRKYARRATGMVYVFTGPIFGESKPRTIGKSKVWVPTAMFKLVYDSATGRSWAHILPNSADAQVGRPVSYQEFVAQTNWRVIPN